MDTGREIGNARPPLMSGYRALDLTDPQGYVCGMFLAELGFEVIKVEKPEGDPGRLRYPFIGGSPDKEKGIYWNSYNVDKKGITLNIETEKGRSIFKELVKKSDVVIESFEPGYLDGLGLGYAELSKVNPKIILTSITPFGQDTSRRNYKGGELICDALAGVMDNIGDEDRAPLIEPSDTCTFYANIAAATGTITALYAANLQGEGQHVDVSIEEAAASRNPQGEMSWIFDRKIAKRMGPYSKYGIAKVRTVWECRDGFVNWTLFAGRMGAKGNAALSAWMNEDGLENPLNGIEDWNNFDMSSMTEKELDNWEECIARFFRNHTKKELGEEGAKRNLSATILAGPDDMLRNEHLISRGYWTELEGPDGTVLPHPKYCLLSSETENFTRKRAPFLGEDNDSVYKELGIKTPLKDLKAEGVI
ncbi:MAG: CoA transferase [Firmicutes bacterium]|nr:CoA transferase [Bacillota bacterium]